MRIILFDIDCLRPDHLGCYGYPRPTSPRMDAVARQGVCFDNYYCADSPCLPSRAGFASGRFGIHSGVVSNVGAGARFHLPTTSYSGPAPEHEMLMRRLRGSGLHTVSFSNFADRHSAYWFMCGWSEFHTPNLKGGSETAEEVHEPLMRWLRHNAKREDYLLHINYWDAHRPYKMDASWAERFGGAPAPQTWPDADAITRHQEIPGPFTAQRQFRDCVSPCALMPGAVRTRQDFDHMVTGYDAAIAYVDHHVGVVLDELERQGALDDTVIIVTSDHGDAFGEHGIYSDHVCADECIHRIPLIVRWPGAAAEGRHCGALLYNVDLSASLCELLGAPIPEAWDGRSFAPGLANADAPGREYLVWGHALYTAQRAVRTRQHLMVRTYDDIGYGMGPVELYDIGQDPYQTHDLASECAGQVAECDRLLSEWLDEQSSQPGAIADPFDAVLEERRAAAT